jgi:hypothetical protein
MAKLALLFILPILFSKEMFSYDSEKVVILCILSFVLGTYFYTKKGLSNVFIEHRNNLKNDIIFIYNAELKLLNKIDSFIEYNRLILFKVLNFSRAISNNVNLILFKINASYFLSILHIGKDYLNLFLKGINHNINIRNLVDAITAENKFASSNLLMKFFETTIASFELLKNNNILNENLLLVYNKAEADVEFTFHSKNYYIFY